MGQALGLVPINVDLLSRILEISIKTRSVMTFYGMFNLTRSWQSGEWDNSLSLAMDATNGQVVGWNFIQTPL